MLLRLQPQACFQKGPWKALPSHLEPFGALYAKMLLCLQREAYFSKTFGSSLGPRIRKCCCGCSSGLVDFEHVAVANVLGMSEFAMCPEQKPQQHSQRRCAQNVSHSNIDEIHVAVANVLRTSLTKMVVWLTFWACHV